jgi:hypothetical protein
MLPIIEAHGLGAFLAGDQAKGKAKAETAKISDRHRKK